MAVATATREVHGLEVPASGAYDIDPAHTSVEFVVRHLGVAKVRGRFGEFSGTLEVGEEPEDSSVEVTIDAASIDTRENDRDQHLRSSDFLDVEQYPELSFASTAVEHADGDHWKLRGDLTIRDVTREVGLEVEFAGAVDDPSMGERAVFSANTEIDREDFGLTWNKALEGGGWLVGKKVRIELEVEAVRS